MFRSNPVLSGFISSALCFFFATTILVSPVAAQPGQECGTVVTPEQIARELAWRAAGIDFSQRAKVDAQYFIPVTAHIVRQSDGSGGLPLSRLDQAMIDLNIAYEPFGMFFYIDEDVDFINNNDFYFSIQSLDLYDSLVNYNRVDSTLNVYFANNTGYCGLGYFYYGVIMDNDCTALPSNASTYPHEVGHFFGLYHTHETAFGVECPDAGNCSTAGDRICDTPADPNLSGLVSFQCTYTGSTTPPAQCTAVPYDPQVRNIMSYSTKPCRDTLTVGQGDKVLFGIESVVPELQHGVTFYSDSTAGWVPVDAVFAGSTFTSSNSWIWDFGDGDSATVKTPTHTYLQAGVFDVSLEAEISGDFKRKERKQFIVALADSVIAPDSVGGPNSSVVLEIYSRNNVPLRQLQIPLTFSGDFIPVFDSFSTVGCRTDYFDNQQFVSFDVFNNRYTVRLRTTAGLGLPELPAGSGPILRLHLRIPSGATAGQVAGIGLEGYSTYVPEFAGSLVTYEPAFTSGSVAVEECLQHGDVDGVPGIAIADLTFLVSFMFKSGPSPTPPELADVDCNASIDVSDITYLVNYMFRGGSAPCGCTP